MTAPAGARTTSDAAATVEWSTVADWNFIPIHADVNDDVVDTITTGTGGWTTYSGTYTMPADQENPTLSIRGTGAGSTGNLLDNVELYVR